MQTSVDIISVGTLSHNRFWNETAPKRTPHATTTLIRDAGSTIVVDPSMPPEVLEYRLDERSGLKPKDIDVVFLTNFRPVHRRGIALFDGASWLMGGDEISHMQAHLSALVDRAESMHEPPDELVESELMLLGRLEPAAEQLTEFVHLFPSPGVTPGSASLLVLSGDRTVAVAGDTIITREYFEHRQIFDHHADADAAKHSFLDVVEIADLIIPGHGDWIFDI